MIDWKFNFDEAPRTGEPVLIWYNGAAWHSEWNRLDNRWSCLSRRDVPEAWAKLNAPKRVAMLPPGIGEPK